MSKRMKKNVQSATEQKPEDVKPEAPVPTAVPEEPQVNVVAPKEEPKASAPSIMDILQTTDPKMLETAQQLGIPLKPLLQWAVGIESIVKAQSEALETLGVKLTPLINLAERAQQAQAQAQAQAQGRVNPEAPQGGDNIGMMMKVVDKVLGSEGSNPLNEKMNAFLGAVLDKELARINQPSRFEALLDEELMKAKAKAIAAVVTKES